ncbi:hypothetical protein VHEMI04255 [[Torrubiella] hemipterigena]|uniref:AB hydrolase-1 domain-containing protein n=1 Tax=[Torrubiella] hemipterigena TaxID=1531966 RepID=A0A0A1T0Q4_9HYPO|nr:hypothetical protein VHEMI04255 [[Torrubiella] hemipterigena]
MRIQTAAALVAISSLASTPFAMNTSNPDNNYSCRSDKHPNPVVMLHGLMSSALVGLNKLEKWLQDQDFCTFSLTYGISSLDPTIGGITPVAESAVEIEDFIKDVKRRTGASKIDLIGHSEGGFQALYVAKFGKIAQDLDKIVAIAPPTHGVHPVSISEYVDGLKALNELLAGLSYTAAGCGACFDLTEGGGGVTRLTDGKIVQPGNKVTIIASRTDEVLFPPETAFVHESGVTNIWVQDVCPKDTTQHVPEGYDMNIWNIALNALEGKPKRRFRCVASPPAYLGVPVHS